MVCVGGVSDRWHKMIYCCEEMKSQVGYRCAQHPDPFDCADKLIHFSEQQSLFGIIIHDGGSSFIAIEYCPWCGQKLSDTPKNDVD
jgi:hypothetical protein